MNDDKGYLAQCARTSLLTAITATGCRRREINQANDRRGFIHRFNPGEKLVYCSFKSFEYSWVQGKMYQD